MVSPSKKKKPVVKPEIGSSLKSKRIFIHITNHAVYSKLEDKLLTHDAVIVPFLDRDVNYVITEIKGFAGSNNPSIKKTVSTECTPSVSNGITTRRSRTRAETMLEKISKSKVKSIENSVLNEALRWKIPIYSLKYFEKWIDSKPKPVEPEKVESGEFCGLRTFSKSFLKLESLLSSDFRPEFREISSWPKIEATSFVGSCPFRKRRKKKKRPKKELEEHPKKRLKPAFNLAVANGGYCEICNEEFLDLDEHVQTPFHSQFANNQKNYAALDKAIAQNSVCYLFGIGRNLRNPRRRTVQPTLERIMPTPTKSNATAEVLKDVEIGSLSAKLSAKKAHTPTKCATKRVPKQALPSGKQEATGSPCASTCPGQETPRRRGRPPKSATATPNLTTTPVASATGSPIDNLSNEFEESGSVALAGLTQRARKLAAPGMLVKRAFAKSSSPECSRKRIAPLKLKVSSRALSKYPSYKIKKERKIKRVGGIKRKKARRKWKTNLGAGGTLVVANNLSDQFNCKLDENESLKEPLEVVCDTVDNCSQAGSIIMTGSVEDSMDHESRSYCGSTGNSQAQSPDDVHQLRPRKHLLLPANLLGTTAEDSAINKSRAVSISPRNATGGLTSACTPKSEKGKQLTSAETPFKKGVKEEPSSRSSSPTPAQEPFRRRVKSLKKSVTEYQSEEKIQATTPNSNDGQNCGPNLVDASRNATILRSKPSEIVTGSSGLLGKPRGEKAKQTPSDNVKFFSSDEKKANDERSSLKLPNENAKVYESISSKNKQSARVNESPNSCANASPKQRRRKLKFQDIADTSLPGFQSPKHKRRKIGSLKNNALGDAELDGSMGNYCAPKDEQTDLSLGTSLAGPPKRGQVGRKKFTKELEAGGFRTGDEKKYESRSNSPILEPLRRKGKPGRKKMVKNVSQKIGETSPKSSDETEVTTSSDHDAYSVASVRELKLSFRKVKKRKKIRESTCALTPGVGQFFKGSAKIGECSSNKPRPLGRPRKNLTKASVKNNSTTNANLSGRPKDENDICTNDPDVETYPAIEDASDESGVSSIEWSDVSQCRGMSHDDYVTSLPHNLTYFGTANSILECEIPFTRYNDDKVVIDPGPSFVKALRAKAKTTKLSNTATTAIAYKNCPNKRKYRKRKMNASLPRLSPRAHASTRANMSNCLKTACETPVKMDEASESQSFTEGENEKKPAPIRGKTKSYEPKDLLKARIRKSISKKMRKTRSATAKEEGKSKLEELKDTLNAFDSYVYRYFSEKKDKKLKPLLDWFLPPDDRNLEVGVSEEDIRNMAYEQLNIDTQLFNRKNCRFFVANRVASDYQAIPDLAKFVATSKKCAAVQCARNNVTSEEQLLDEVSLLDHDKMGFTVTGERRKRRPPNRYNQFVMSDKFFADDDASPFAHFNPDLSSKMRKDAMALFGPTSFQWKKGETCAKGSLANVENETVDSKNEITRVEIDEIEIEKKVEIANDEEECKDNVKIEMAQIESTKNYNVKKDNSEIDENVESENANAREEDAQIENTVNFNARSKQSQYDKNLQNENMTIEVTENENTKKNMTKMVNAKNRQLEIGNPPVEDARNEITKIGNVKILSTDENVKKTKSDDIDIELQPYSTQIVVKNAYGEDEIKKPRSEDVAGSVVENEESIENPVAIPGENE